MTPEKLCEVLMTYNTLSGILFAIGFVVVVIFVLRNENDYSYYEEYEEYDEVEEHDEYWWK